MNKEQKIITAVGAAILLALVAFVIIVKPGASNLNSNSNLKSNSNNFLLVEEKNFDFGSISMAAGKVSHSFKIKNTNPQDVLIKKIYTSCMCTVASLVKNDKKYGPFGMAGHGLIPSVNQDIKINEEAVIEVVFDPAAHGPAGVGRVERNVYIETEDGQTSEIGFTVTVTP